MMAIRIANLLLAALFLLSTTWAQPAWSASGLTSVARFAIPAGALPGALHMFTEQSGIQVTSPSDLVDMKQSAGVSGELPAAQALTQLLMGTQLEFDAIDSRTVSIHRVGHAAATGGGNVSYMRTASTAPVGATVTDATPVAGTTGIAETSEGDAGGSGGDGAPARRAGASGAGVDHGLLGTGLESAQHH